MDVVVTQTTVVARLRLIHSRVVKIEVDNLQSRTVSMEIPHRYALFVDACIN